MLLACPTTLLCAVQHAANECRVAGRSAAGCWSVLCLALRGRSLHETLQHLEGSEGERRCWSRPQQVGGAAAVEAVDAILCPYLSEHAQSSVKDTPACEAAHALHTAGSTIFLTSLMVQTGTFWHVDARPRNAPVPWMCMYERMTSCGYVAVEATIFDAADTQMSSAGLSCSVWPPSRRSAICTPIAARCMKMES